jgi:ribosome-associated translation inhibitor RaiA
MSGGQLYTDSVESDKYAAIATLTDKLDRRIKRNKKNLSNHHPTESGKREFS